MLNVGDVLQRRYEVRGRIGRGGMATVYTVFDQRLQTLHALKEADISDEAERQQFEREARLLAPLRHPALPRVLDHFEDGGRSFLVMELIPGDDLARMLALRGGPFDPPTVLGWADDLLDALDYIHTRPQPIIHRDIKPSNLKLNEAGRIMLLDFGIAKQQQTGALTIGSAKAFSYAYSPLEQFGATSRTDARSDIYALGATLYHLLAGSAPPSAAERAQGTSLPPLADRAPTCPLPVAAAVERAMGLRPDQRYQSAAEMRQALAHARAADAPTRRAPPPQHPRRPSAAAATGETIALRPAAPAAARRRSGLGVTMLLLIIAVALALALAFVALSAGMTRPTPAASPTTVARAATAAPAPTAAPEPTTPPPTVAVARVAQRPRQITASGVAPPSIDANGSTITYDPANVADGRLDTTWRVAGSGIGASLTIELDAPTIVSEVQLVPGYAKVDPLDGTDRFFQNRRVQRVRLEFDDGRSVEASFEEVARLQSIRFAPVRTAQVRIVILATTEPGEADGGRDFTPISEVVVLGDP